MAAGASAANPPYPGHALHVALHYLGTLDVTPAPGDYPTTTHWWGDNLM